MEKHMLGKKLSYQTNGSTVEFEFEHGTAYVTAVTDTTVLIICKAGRSTSPVVLRAPAN